ncbi:MAG: hypothetical protein ACPGVT_13980 [Maricaulaceae bacterium]
MNIFKTALLSTAIIEAVTLLFRFGLKMESTRDTGFMKVLTFGFRIHHGYVGVVILLLCLLLRKRLLGKKMRKCFTLLCGLAIGLIASDLIHHFLVLWPLTGDPQFHLRYPS